MDLVLLGLCGEIAIILGVEAGARCADKNSAQATLSMLSGSVAFLFVILLLFLICVKPHSDHAVAWRCAVALASFLGSFVYRG